MKPFPTAEDFLERIEPDWKLTVDGVLKAAAIVAEAAVLLRKVERHDFMERIDGQKKMYQRLKRIGNYTDFYTEGVKDHLPSSYATLEEITRLRPAQFRKALASGLINKKVTREQAKVFRTGKGAIKGTRPENYKLLTIVFDRTRHSFDALDDLREKIERLVAEFKTQPGTDGIQIQDHGVLDRLIKKYQSEYDAPRDKQEREILRLAKRYINKKRRLKLKSVKDFPADLRANIIESRKRRHEIFSEEISGIDTLEALDLCKVEIGLDDFEFQRMEYGDGEFQRFKRLVESI